MSYILSVATHRNLDLAAMLPSELADVVRRCLRGQGYYVSQELAAIWISEGIDSVVFPSATGAGRNIAVYLANAAADSVLVRNRAEVLAALRQPRMGKRGR
jgi:RES domain-containing protein